MEDGGHVRRSGRARKAKRSYSPAQQGDSLCNVSNSATTAGKRTCSQSVLSDKKSRRNPSPGIQKECVAEKNKVIKTKTIHSSHPCTSAADNEECVGTFLHSNTFWNFASSVSRSIERDKIASDAVVVLLLEDITKSLRRLIAGAKLFMERAERQKLLCDDLNSFIALEGGKPLYGFMEENSWQKIGDVFVPKDETLDLSYCTASVKLETCHAT